MPFSYYEIIRYRIKKTLTESPNSLTSIDFELSQSKMRKAQLHLTWKSWKFPAWKLFVPWVNEKLPLRSPSLLCHLGIAKVQGFLDFWEPNCPPVVIVKKPYFYHKMKVTVKKRITYCNEDQNENIEPENKRSNTDPSWCGREILKQINQNGEISPIKPELV